MNIVNTPYDDVFRTMLNDCSSLIIPVINEIFNERYCGNEKIVFSPEIHFVNQQDGDETKRITDSSFTIIGEKETKIFIRVSKYCGQQYVGKDFEYATQIALDQGELENNVLKVEIPRSAILFLRSNGATPDKMTIEIKTPGGVNSFDVPVMKAQKYSIDDIFEKGLLFLIPFYIFSHESRFQEYELDEDALKELKIEYMEIVKRLNSLLESGSISVYTKKDDCRNVK